MKIKALLKANIYQVLLVFISFLIMVLVSYFYVSAIVRQQMQDIGDVTMEALQTSVSTRFRGTELLFANFALTVEGMLANHASNEDILHSLKKPDAFYNSVRTHVPDFLQVYGYIRGEWLDASDWVPPPGFVPENRPWYVGAENNVGRIFFSEPYVDAATGEMAVTFSRKMFDREGNAHGVLAVDMRLIHISALVRNQKIAGNGYGVLIDDSMTFVVHRKQALLGTKMDSAKGDYPRLMNMLDSGDQISAIQFRDADNTESIIFFRTMPNGWHIGVIIPRSSYYREAYSLAVVLGALDLLLMSVLSSLLIRTWRQKTRADEESSGKSSFLAKMSHEIRTPLNSIIGMAEIISRKIHTKGAYREIHEFVAIIQQSGQSLLAIINDILDFSKIESGSVRLNESRYSFASLLNDVINIVSVQIVEHRAVNFIARADVDIPHELFGDEVRVRQILVNLLSNAIKYTMSGHITLDVRLEERNGDVVSLALTVKDTGIGIREEDLQAIFSEFKRVDSRFNQKIEGTGLGLAIVKNLCRLMRGEVRIASVHGSGSEFTAAIRQKAGSEKKLAAVVTPGQKRVLLLKGEERQHASLVSALRDLGLPEPKTVDDLCSFTEELASAAYDHAFLPARYAREPSLSCESACLEICREKSPGTQLVVMAALGDVTAIPGIWAISLPTYCVPLANVLNGVVSPESRGQDADGLPWFSAPTAAVLVVDDVPTNLRVAKEFLDYYDISVETCTDGAEALALVEGKQYDLVLMDHMMPKMNGLEATLRIRQMGRHDEYFRNVPIVALTANAVVGQKEIFLQHGFTDFLSKPIDAQALDAVLKKWIPQGKQQTGLRIAPGNLADTPAVRANLVEGLDLEKGIENIGGRKAAYAGVLSLFRQDCEPLTRGLLAALADGDLPAYTVAAHALKGSLRTIGAGKLSATAMQLENAAANGDAAFLQGNTQTFLDDLKTLTCAFDLVLPALAAREEGGSGAGAAENKALPGKLEELQRALASMDARAVNELLAECLGMELSPGQRTLVEELDILVMAFEFEKAAARIRDFSA